MSDQEMLRAILEWAGWKPMAAPECQTHWIDPDGIKHNRIPPLTLDLCASLEAKLGGMPHRAYGEQLQEILSETRHYGLPPLYSKQPWSGEDVTHIARATKEQRLLAIHKTLFQSKD